MKKNWVELYKKYGIYILLVVVFAFFAVAAPNFLAAKNVINILRQVSMFGIVVVGVCMVMIGGGMDLSVGMQMAVDGMLIGYMMVNLNVPIPLAIVITIVVGCLLGAANGIIAVKMHIAPIIVTLGTMLVLQGVAYLITGGYPITGMPEAFKVIGQGYVGIIPVPVIIFVLFIIFGAILMNKTYLGRYIYALGGNKEAARLAGINVDKLTVAVYTFCGFCASIAALIMVGRTNCRTARRGQQLLLRLHDRRMPWRCFHRRRRRQDQRYGHRRYHPWHSGQWSGSDERQHQLAERYQGSDPAGCRCY